MNGAYTGTIRKPFIDHIKELQFRLTLSTVVLGICSLATYPLYPVLLDLIQRPLGQTLYYTSPTGGFNFIFKICLVSGLILSLPFLLYQIFCFAEPLMNKISKRVILKYVLWAFILSVGGVLFGYLISLPAALRFLTAIGGDSIQSLIRADEYFNFALAYIAGFALIFQVPLIMLFINRIKPLKPGRMMKFQRYIILFSFIISAVLTPTPDPINQAIMALPMVFLYQVGIGLVWLVNKKRFRTAKKVPKASSRASAYKLVSMKIPDELLIAPPKVTISGQTGKNPKPLNTRLISDVSTTPFRTKYPDRAIYRSTTQHNAYSRPHTIAPSSSVRGQYHAQRTVNPPKV